VSIALPLFEKVQGRNGVCGAHAQLEACGFVAHCSASNEHWPVPLANAADPRAAPDAPQAATHGEMRALGLGRAQAGAQLSLTGPAWLGPLGDAPALRAMALDAAGRGGMRAAQKLLAAMQVRALQIRSERPCCPLPRLSRARAPGPSRPRCRTRLSRVAGAATAGRSRP
jgi:tRNA G26 N,N-dimethylase Trm1